MNLKPVYLIVQGEQSEGWYDIKAVAYDPESADILCDLNRAGLTVACDVVDVIEVMVDSDRLKGGRS